MTIALTCFAASLGIYAGLAQFQVPLHIQAGSMCVKLVMNGRSGWFYVDSGSLDTEVTAEFAKKYGLNGDDAKLATIDIGGAEVQGVPVGSLDSGPNSLPKATVPLVGILGYSCLRMISFGVDFDHIQAYAWPTTMGSTATDQLFTSGVPMETIPVKVKDGWPAVPISQDGKNFYAILDTGSSVGSFSSSKFVLLNGGHLAVNTPKGDIQSALSVVSGLQLGTQHLPPQLAFRGQSSEPSVLGTTTFIPFHKVLYDFDGGKLEFAKEPLDELRYYLSLIGLVEGTSGKAYSRSEAGELKNTGFNLKEIVSINDVRVQDLNSNPLGAGQLLTSRKGIRKGTQEKVVIALSNGKSTEIDFQNYANGISGPVGSGTVSSAAKQIAAQFSKGPGIYWVTKGTYIWLGEGPSMWHFSKASLVGTQFVATGGFKMAPIVASAQEPGTVLVNPLGLQ